ncbi:hypothetical protein, partial [Lacticaseibacillus thailandensis]|uniref:hypothetical protein n=1 Tax=Lacticaseibacillus thailandensis TaxID=381741 RepID=UPI001F30ED5E
GNLDILSSVVVTVNTLLRINIRQPASAVQETTVQGATEVARPEQHKISYQPPGGPSSTLTHLFEL